MGPDTSSIQSLLQLSVALNLGFIGYIAITGDRLYRERSKIDDLFSQVSLIVNERRLSGAEGTRELSDVVDSIVKLKSDLNTASQQNDYTSKALWRFLVVISAFVSFFLLSLVSFNIGSSIIFYVGVIAVLCFLPLIWVLGENFFRSSSAARQLGQRRIKLDNDFAEALTSIDAAEYTEESAQPA